MFNVQPGRTGQLQLLTTILLAVSTIHFSLFSFLDFGLVGLICTLTVVFRSAMFLQM